MALGLATRPNETWAMDVVLDQLGEAAFLSKTAGSIAGRPWGLLFILVSAPTLHFSRHPNVDGRETWAAWANGQNSSPKRSSACFPGSKPICARKKARKEKCFP